jgi:uncharacterized membrane protein YjjP (DUF1212 family)
MMFLEYGFYGLLGAVVYTLVRWGFWREKGYDYLFRHFAWGFVAGLIVYLFNLPNHFTAFGLGYLGIDVAEGFLNRLLGVKEK